MIKTKKVIFYSLLTLLQSTSIDYAAEQQEHNQQQTQSCTQPDFHLEDSEELIEFKELVKNAERDSSSRETLLMRLHKGLISDYFKRLIPIKKILSFSVDLLVFGHYDDLELETLVTLLPPQDLTVNLVEHIKTKAIKEAYAQNLMGYMHKKGKGVPKDLDMAVDYFNKATAKNYALAYLNLGLFYYETKEYILAIKLFTTLANEQNHAEAHYNLGVMYDNAIGTERNIDKAIHHFTIAADQGCSDAQNMLGTIYCLKQDFKNSLHYIQLAANQYDKIGLYNLGRLYYDGEIVEKNINMALAYNQASANQGCDEAQHFFGYLYYEGKDIPQDMKTSFHWYTLAAEQGHSEAQFMLSHFYLEGKMIEQNVSEAFKYAKLSAEQGNTRGKERLKALESSYTARFFNFFGL